MRPNRYDYLKVIALLAMIVDHIGYFIYPDMIELRLIGRISFPLFLLLVGYNGHYQNKIQLWIYAISIQLIFYLLYHYGLTPLMTGNILITIAVTRILLSWITKQSLSIQIVIFIISIILGNATNNYVEYGTWSIAFGLIGWWMYHYKSTRVIILQSILLTCYGYMLINLGFGQNLFALWSIIIVLLLLGSWIHCDNRTKHISPLSDKIIVRLSGHTLDIYIVSGIALWGISMLL